MLESCTLDFLMLVIFEKDVVFFKLYLNLTVFKVRITFQNHGMVAGDESLDLKLEF